MALPELSEEQATKLVTGDWGQAIKDLLLSYAFTFSWYNTRGNNTERICNGTVFVLDTSYHIFAVTAAHVYNAYLAAKKKEPNLQAYFGNLQINPDTQIRSCGNGIDIATFDITDEQINTIGCTPVTRWPPTIPNEGCGVFFGGFAGVDVVQEGRHEFAYAFRPGILPARTVTDHQITVHVERQHLVDRVSPPPNFDAGGFSGGPLFALIEGNLQDWRLSGVISEASSTLETFTAVRAVFITDDGRVANRV